MTSNSKCNPASSSPLETNDDCGAQPGKNLACVSFPSCVCVVDALLSISQVIHGIAAAQEDARKSGLCAALFGLMNGEDVAVCACAPVRSQTCACAHAHHTGLVTEAPLNGVRGPGYTVIPLPGQELGVRRRTGTRPGCHRQPGEQALAPRPSSSRPRSTGRCSAVNGRSLMEGGRGRYI